MTKGCAPKMPETPSRTINKMLQDRCGKAHTNMVKAGLAYYICGFFQVITTFYNVIRGQSKDSHRAWMISCGVISSLVVLKAYLIYNIILASAFVMHTLLYYGAVCMGLFGVGLGVSGAVFFDKDGNRSSSSVSSTVRRAAPSPAPEPARIVPQKVKEFENVSATPSVPVPATNIEESPATNDTPDIPAAPEPAQPEVEEKKDI